VATRTQLRAITRVDGAFLPDTPIRPIAMFPSPLIHLAQFPVAVVLIAFASSALGAEEPMPPAPPAQAPAKTEAATPNPPPTPGPTAPATQTKPTPKRAAAEKNATREQIRKKTLERFDKDGNGSLNADERAAAKAEAEAKLLERFDADGDGRLSEEERAETRGPRRARPQNGPGIPPPGTEKPDEAKPDQKKPRAKGGPIRARLLKRFDADGDGTLSESERAAAKKARQKGDGRKPG